MSKTTLTQSNTGDFLLATPGELASLGAEQALDQVQYLHGLLLNVNQGFWEWHPETGVQRATGNVWQQLHENPDIALSSIWSGDLSLVHADERDALRALRSRLSQQGTFVDTAFRATSRDGQPVWLRLWARAFTDPAGDRFFLGGCTDYSEPLEARGPSNFSSERLQNALDAVGDGFWEWDLRVDEVVLSEACWQLLGYPRRQSDADARAALARWKTHMLHEDYPDVKQAMEDTVRERLPLDVEYRLKHQQGHVIWVRCRGNLQTSSAGQPIRVLGTLQDVTAGKKKQLHAEQELLRLKQENKGRAELISSLGHELRTPLNAILGFSQMVELDQSVNPDQRLRLAEIRKAGQHLLHLVGDVLDLARIDSNRLAPSIELVQPANLVADCRQLLEPLAETRKVSLTFEPLGWERAYILADPVRFKQVVLNLVGNAIKYNRENGRVVISLVPQAEGWLRLSVLDTGCGIPTSKQPQVFEPFNRLGAEQGKIEGTGVGLAIARQLTEAMGGRIGFDSEEGQGSVFWIDFLMNDAPSEVLRMAARPDYAKALPPCRLLYVTGHTANANRLRGVLSSVEQIVVQVCNDAMKGIFSARTAQPDLILVDDDLHGVLLKDFSSILRQDPATARIPLVGIMDQPAQCVDLSIPINYDLAMLSEALRRGLSFEFANDDSQG
ncbi:hybrid sensor histidine kinase/response regulator [Microbulbifer agarilyticus]|uniref:hybrid sensor histidine kinase/response regulator n=1 Tax=Microbulbifer agarilyticus TaxID=260552 RepID=UPI001CD4DD17|nr:ATP-binding protein [Microbulbifer agarilyticus]MCA0894267.1 PAS domain-containing protein [Microbulbifer agarilyticus]